MCDPDGTEELSRADCLQLLAEADLGRLAISHRALPAIVLVNYCVLGERVVFALGTGSEALGPVRGNVIAFEVDDVDLVTHTGWSVVLVGQASRLGPQDPDWPAAAGRHLHALVPAPGVELLALPAARLSGHRLTGGRPMAAARELA